jgi:LCP family protein required for cell wall assembly
MSRKKKIILIIAIVLVIIGALVGGAFIFANNYLNKITYTTWEDTEVITDDELELESEDEEELETLEVVEEEDVEFAFDENDILEKVPHVSNILLIGEENVYKDERGRTDSMMILSINTVEKTIKLTSLMRDSYVKIPDHKDNRLNAAYTLGGVPLLVSTIETNFGILIDNTVLVNFKAFQNIIDILGGVDIELTQAEADYLNTTNYISKHDDSTECFAGMNHFNGMQALGYCRVRYVKGIDGESNDFGRTNRQRTVLSQLYQNYKDASLTTLLELVNEILPYVTTDMTKDEIIDYVMVALTLKSDELETFRLPMDNAYQNVSIRGMSVLNLDWEKNRAALKEFIYGELPIDEDETETATEIEAETTSKSEVESTSETIPSIEVPQEVESIVEVIEPQVEEVVPNTIETVPSLEETPAIIDTDVAIDPTIIDAAQPIVENIQ